MVAGLPLHAFTYFVHLAHFIFSVIRSTFTLTSLKSLFYSKCYGLRGRFLPTDVFYIVLLFVSQKKTGKPIRDPPLFLIRWNCSFQLAHGFELLMF